MVNELSNAVLNAKHEMEYLEVRENLHRASKFCVYTSSRNQ